jgi:hypothetical protein
MDVILAENPLYLRVQEFQAAVRLQHVGCAICKYLLESRRYGEPAFVFDRHRKRVTGKDVDALEYVRITVVERRQVSHICHVRLKNIVYRFGKRLATKKSLGRRFVQRIGILFFQPSPGHADGHCIWQGRGRRRTNRACSPRNISIPYLTNDLTRCPRIVRVFSLPVCSCGSSSSCRFLCPVIRRRSARNRLDRLSRLFLCR